MQDHVDTSYAYQVICEEWYNGHIQGYINKQIHNTVIQCLILQVDLYCENFAPYHGDNYQSNNSNIMTIATV